MFEAGAVRLWLPPNWIGEIFTFAVEGIDGVCRGVHTGEVILYFICHLGLGYLGISLITGEDNGDRACD